MLIKSPLDFYSSVCAVFRSMKKNIFTITVVLMAHIAFAEQKQSCAVLNFFAERGVDSGQAGIVANRFSVLAARSGLYEVLPRYKVNTLLINAEFQRGAVSTLSSAVAAGRLLGVDLVIYGKTGSDKGSYYLITFLVDVANEKELKTSVYRSSESMTDFLKTAPAENIKILLEIPVIPEPAPITSIAKVTVEAEVTPEKQKTVASGQMTDKANPPGEPEPDVISEPTQEPKPVINKEPKPEAQIKPQEATPVFTHPKPPIIIPQNEPEAVPEPKPAPEPETVPDQATEVKTDVKIEVTPETNTKPVSEEEKPVSLEEVSVKESEIEQLTLPESEIDPAIKPLRKWPSLSRIAVGTRFTHFSLMDDSGDFLGSIDKLDAQQSYLPNKLFVEYMITHRYGLELTWDKLQASTITTSDGHNDGDIVLSGPIVTAFARGSFDVDVGRIITFRPYGGLGLGFMTADFEHEGWWHHGFSATEWQDAEAAYETWVSEGSEEWPNNGYERTMSLDDTIGLVLTGGCSVDITRAWSIDLYLRYMKVSTDDTYTLSSYGSVFRTTYYTFDMDNIAFGLGVKYDF